jgi:surface antigen
MAVAALAAALAAGGCSTSFQLGALGGKDTATTTASTPRVTPASFDIIAEGDIAVAKSAVSALFARGVKDASAPWENPRTGAHGTVTPIATAYAQDGTQCQDFLVSFVQGERETWYQGGACRKGSGWEVREIRALQRT